MRTCRYPHTTPWGLWVHIAIPLGKKTNPKIEMTQRTCMLCLQSTANVQMYWINAAHFSNMQQFWYSVSSGQATNDLLKTSVNNNYMLQSIHLVTIKCHGTKKAKTNNNLSISPFTQCMLWQYHTARLQQMLWHSYSISSAQSGTVRAGMGYRHFFCQLETIPPFLSGDCHTSMS